MTPTINTITIENCNNIIKCDFSVGLNMLNVKYAINGTGKSTISKAIKIASTGGKLDSLTPFSVVSSKDKSKKPTVSNLEFNNVAVFDDDYLKQYVYQKTDLLKNTFEVMIYSDEYTELKNQIDETLKDVKNIARDKANVNTIREITQSLCKLLVVNKDNITLSRKQAAVKSLIDDKKGALFNLPDELSEFKPFIDDEKAIEWASWKLKGISSFSEKGKCPYCAGDDTENTKKQTEIFKDSFDENSITYSNKLKEFLEGIKDYIDEKKMNHLLKSINSTADRATLEMQLVKLRTEANYLSSRLYVLANFDGFSIDYQNMDDFEKKFREMIIDEATLDFFNTDLFLNEIRPLNEQVKAVLDMIGRLKGEVAKFRSYLKKQINHRKDDINNFLTAAGFNYIFDIIIENQDVAHAVLKYKLDDDNYLDVNTPDKHLSWGEKNAFALLMFMYDAISKNADLIILDDPISSFDSNKKYAIINRLFKTGDKENSLYQRTVLLLTHDFEPVIDYIQVGGKLSGDTVNADYLQNSNGFVNEKKIQKNVDMMSMVVLMKDLALDETAPIPVRLGCLRKYYEHTIRTPKEDSIAYNVLSSLIHGRTKPSYDTEGIDLIDENDVIKAEEDIKRFINDFDYSKILQDCPPEKLINIFEEEINSYYKLLILRAYIERSEKARDRLKASNDVLRKYADETYHIENDYMYSLDVRKFNIVPQYYMEATNEFMKSEKDKLLSGEK